MRNSKFKKFENMVSSIIEEEKKRINFEVAKHLETFETIEFIKFNYREPYEGELKNKIFLTYSDGYRHNIKTSMTIGYLNQPHTSIDDRGYIKGVAIDLDGYMKLRSAKMMKHNIDITTIYHPIFRKSKNSDIYTKACLVMLKSALETISVYILDQQKVLNEKLHEMTGCSLLHYLNNI